MKQYDPKLVIISFLGQPITGFASGTFVEADRNVDTWTLVVGAGGETCRIRSNDKSGKVTITLMQGSDSNKILSAAAAVDEQLGISVGALIVKDINGVGDFVFAKEAFLMRPAKKSRGKDLSDTQWVLVCPEIVIAHDGYLSPSVVG